MRDRGYRSAILVAIALFLLSAGVFGSDQAVFATEAASGAAPSGGELGADKQTSTAEPKIYLIRKGDTLWDISHSQLRDPFMWPKVWQANQRIKNPDLIYPGNRLVIPAELAKPQEPEQAASAPPAIQAPETTAAEPLRIPATPSPSTVSEKEVPSGTITWVRLMSPSIRMTLPTSSRVLRSKDEQKKLMTAPDAVYLVNGDGAYTVGQRLMIYRIVKKVHHPVTGKFMGTLIRPVAVVEVVANDQDLTVTHVRQSVDYIEKGDRAADFASMAAEESAAVGGAADVSGIVAEVQEERELSTTTDIVFLDRGQNAGLKPGDRLRVIRPGGYDKGCCIMGKGIRLPDNPIGEVEILSTQSESATAMIVKVSDAVAIGDRVVSKQ